MNKSQTLNDSNQQSHPLKRALRGNAIFSGVSGIIALLGAQPLANFTGIGVSTVLYIIGAVLIFYAVDLWWVSSQEPINQRIAWVAIILDLLWVLGSIGILVSGWPSLTVAGRWTVFFLAEIVAAFAIWQYISVSRSK